jgi:hypothetical protein
MLKTIMLIAIMLMTMLMAIMLMAIMFIAHVYGNANCNATGTAMAIMLLLAS